MPRGTCISLYLKEEAHEFLKTDAIKNLVNKYSQFINFPISIWQEVEEEREVEFTEEELEEQRITKEAEKEVDGEDEDDAEVEDEEEEESAPATKTEMVKENKFVVENSVKPIWTRTASEITDEEYTEFYRSISNNKDEPAAKTHFSAEGEIGFKAMLFIPGGAAKDLCERVRNIFFEELF